MLDKNPCRTLQSFLFPVRKGGMQKKNPAERYTAIFVLSVSNAGWGAASVKGHAAGPTSKKAKKHGPHKGSHKHHVGGGAVNFTTTVKKR